MYECDMCGEFDGHDPDCPFGPRVYEGSRKLTASTIVFDRERSLDYADKTARHVLTARDALSVRRF